MPSTRDFGRDFHKVSRDGFRCWRLCTEERFYFTKVAAFTGSRFLYSVTLQTGMCGGHEGKEIIVRNSIYDIVVECCYTLSETARISSLEDGFLPSAHNGRSSYDPMLRNTTKILFQSVKFYFVGGFARNTNKVVPP